MLLLLVFVLTVVSIVNANTPDLKPPECAALVANNSYWCRYGVSNCRTIGTDGIAVDLDNVDFWSYNRVTGEVGNLWFHFYEETNPNTPELQPLYRFYSSEASWDKPGTGCIVP